MNARERRSEQNGLALVSAATTASATVRAAHYLTISTLMIR